MTPNRSLANTSAAAGRVEAAATIQWLARSKALKLDAVDMSEMGAPGRAIDVLSKAVDTSSLASAGAMTAVMAFIENAGNASAFLSMVSEQAFRRAPFDVPLIHTESLPIPSGLSEGGLIPVGELELEGKKLTEESVGVIVVASDQAWMRVDGPGQAFINGLLQSSIGRAVDVRMFELLAGSAPVNLTAAKDAPAAIVTALGGALQAMLTKSGQVMRWAVSPAAAAVLAPLSADGRISVTPAGGMIFGIPATISEGLDPGEIALIAASDIAAGVTDFGITNSRASALRLPGGEALSLFQLNLIGVRAVMSFGVEPLADAVMAKVTLTE
jgi:hypothetical protein